MPENKTADTFFIFPHPPTLQETSAAHRSRNPFSSARHGRRSPKRKGRSPCGQAASGALNLSPSGVFGHRPQSCSAVGLAASSSSHFLA
eukprot:4414625-Prymnesium_polylepis.2